MDWLKYIRSVLPNDIEINENEIILLQNPQHVQHLELTLEHTRKRVLSNYLIWRAIYSASFHLNDELFERRLKFTEEFTGRTLNNYSRYDCYEHTENQ